MTEHRHMPSTEPPKFILRRMENGEYFPLTQYHCSTCAKDYVSDGIWWAIQGIPASTIFEPEPETNEIIIDVVFGKIKSVKQARRN